MGDPTVGNPAVGDPTVGDPGQDMRVLGAVAFLAVGAALNIVVVAVGLDHVRPGERPSFVATGPLLLLLAVWVRWRGYTGPLLPAAIMTYGNLAVVMSARAFVDPHSLTATPVLFVLTTIYVALFMPPVALPAQALVAAGGTVYILDLADPAAEVLLMQATTVLVAVVSPAVLVLVLRLRLERSVTAARRLAVTDPLTGLLNRRGLDQQAGPVLAAANRSGTTVGVFVADVDHFKRVNDRHGHADGDQVLRVVAAAVRRCVRRGDVVARFGGEEIVVVAALPPRALTLLAERIRAEVARAAAAWQVTVSVGVAWGEVPDGAATEMVWRLIDDADALMYAAKHGGRNQVCAMAAA